MFFSAIGENTVAQLHHWSAVNPENADDIFNGTLPTLRGVTILATITSISKQPF